MQPILIAHRGDTVDFPENTLESFESAFEKGADGVEFDIQLIDKQLKVVHNYLFDTSKKYPLLQQVLENFVPKGRLEIDIKAFSGEILDPMKDVLSQFPTDNIELTTTEMAMAVHIKKAFPDINLGVIFGIEHYQPWMSEDFFARKTLELMETMNAQVAHLSGTPKEQLTSTLVKKLHDNNIVIHYHIPKIELEQQLELFQMLVNLGVDQATIDDIDLVEELKANNGGS